MGSVLEKNSERVRKRIEGHTFDDEGGEEYEGSAFGGFGDYFRRKKIKLQNLDADLRAGSDKPQIFKGVVAHVTGYTQPPLHVLHQEIVQHGGGFLQYLDSKTMATHIIASTLPPKKSVDYSRYRIVKPNWVTDSISEGKLLPWANYRVLDEGPRQKVLKFDSQKGLSQASPKARQGYREQTDKSFYTSQYKSSALPSLPGQSFSQAVQSVGNSSGPSKQAQNDAIGLALDTETQDDIETRIEPPAARVQGAKAPETTVTDLSASKNRTSEPPKNATSEEHNAWLLSDPRLRKSSTANPEFLKQYYSESRLHHLSTWKAELKTKMQRLANEQSSQAARPTKRAPGARRYVMHVDFDSFFCAVSLKKYPQLASKPVVVAHSDGSGSEIASCNYPARAFGVKNGMWMKTAKELCPDLQVVPYDFPAYEEASQVFYEAILKTGGIVQSVSIDEALIDVTSIVLGATGSSGTGVDEGSFWREQHKVAELATSIRDDIRQGTGCEVSVGIGGNILLAKVALRKAKPAGQYHLKPDDVLSVIGQLKVDDLPGVAHSTSGKLEEIGVKLVKDLRDVSRQRLEQALGPKTSEKLSGYARGIDKTEVGEQTIRKSVSAEVNWGIRFLNQPEAEEFVMNLCKELEKRLLDESVRGSQLTMKIMRRSLDAPLDPAKHLGHGKCDTFNKSVQFGVPTHDAERIGNQAVSMLRSYGFSAGDLRGLGVQMTKLEPLKATALPDGSQKKLSFGAAPKTVVRRVSSQQEAIAEDDEIQQAASRLSKQEMSDPIDDDPMTPRKPKMPSMRTLSKTSDTNTPLNVQGTQFLIPSNVDAATLAELPNDIRSRLMAQASRPSTRPGSPAPKSRSESPLLAEPLPSQVDAEVFDALPDDMKAEVLAQYRKAPQSPLKQSPQKNNLGKTRQPTTPTKRGGKRGMITKATRQRDALAGLVQTSFFGASKNNDSEAELEELDPGFLAELPEDMRKELIADHRRQKMARLSKLNAPERRQHMREIQSNNDQGILNADEVVVQFQQPPNVATFAETGMTSTQEIKDMIEAWHRDTLQKGPHSRDVKRLAKYLKSVVRDEQDLEKVVKVMKWLQVVVDQGKAVSSKEARTAWKMTIGEVTQVVQNAVKARGLAPLKF